MLGCLLEFIHIFLFWTMGLCAVMLFWGDNQPPLQTGRVALWLAVITVVVVVVCKLWAYYAAKHGSIHGGIEPVDSWTPTKQLSQHHSCSAQTVSLNGNEICSFCISPLIADNLPLVKCNGCGNIMHSECLASNWNECTVYGCRCRTFSRVTSVRAPSGP